MGMGTIGKGSYSKLIQENSGSINDSMMFWADKSLGFNFIKNDIVKYKNCFYYAIRDHTKTVNTEPETSAGLDFWGGTTTLVNNQKIPQFIWVPSYTSSIQHKPSVSTIRFGNGYEQRISKSINPDLKVLQLSFDQRTSREARAIGHFLKDKAATRSFAYNPKDIYSDLTFRTKYVCREWEFVFNFKENYSIKAKFEEVSA